MDEDRITIPSYKSNSLRAKDDELITSNKKVEKAITGDVKIRKKGFFAKLRESFFDTDDTKSVGSYIFSDILIPSLKKALDDIITVGKDTFLYGETRRSSRSSGGSKISYQKYYESDYRARERAKRVSGYEVKEIVVDTKADAELVLDQLEELISTYGLVSVSDFYDIVGVTGSYNDSYYGWDSMANMTSRPTRDGWLIVLPKPTQLK